MSTVGHKDDVTLRDVIKRVSNLSDESLSKVHEYLIALERDTVSKTKTSSSSKSTYLCVKCDHPLDVCKVLNLRKDGKTGWRICDFCHEIQLLPDRDSLSLDDFRRIPMF